MGRCVAWLVLGLFAPFFLSAALAAEAGAGDAPGSCDGVAFGDAAKGLRFDLAGACARLTGEIQNVYQNDLSTEAGGVPTAITANGTPSFARSIDTATALAILDTRRQTPLGELSTDLLAQWQKASDDGTTAGTATIQRLYGSLDGGTLGYAGSLMNFWNGDFQFLATTPDLSVGIASYELGVADHLRLALAVEFGLPTAEQTTQGITSLDFASPTLTSRLRYATARGLTLHLSGLLRQAEFPAYTSPPPLARSGSIDTGWAASLGAAIPVPVTGKSDQASLQAVYAVDALQTLGTKADLVALQSAVHLAVPTSGWSIVASFSHAWTRALTSNAFVSYIDLDADLSHARPSAQSTRVAANLYWRPFDRHPFDGLRVGAELGLLCSDLAANGAPGFLSGSSGTGVLGFLSTQWNF